MQFISTTIEFWYPSLINFKLIKWECFCFFRASGWEPPLYGHLPLITNSDGTKLSKRQGDIRISQYRNSGIFPFALLQYITQAGGGFKTGSQFSSSIEELVENVCFLKHYYYFFKFI